MRNYYGYRNGSGGSNGTGKSVNEKTYARDNNIPEKHSERTKLVIEDNTIYEIDLDCYECLKRQKSF